MTHFDLDDTIGALASAPGGACRGIIRVSGPQAVASTSGLFEPDDEARWRSCRFASAHAGVLRLAGLRTPIPITVYWWPAGRSYTGQPVVEIHAPGSPPLLEAVLAALYERGVRPATAGEFTLRAFLSGRIDLVEAEAVLGVIDAADRQDLLSALKQLAGGLSGRIAHSRGDLLNLLADLEAGLDFVEEDIRFVSHEEVVRRISDAELAIDTLLAQCGSRMQSTGRARVVLAGLPNAGKSTLFNALVGREAALVSPTAGTTRDYLCAPVDWQGLAVELVDTAGWDEFEGRAGRPEDAISHAAQRQGQDQFVQADLVVWCSACDSHPDGSAPEAAFAESLGLKGRPVLFVSTKSDLALAIPPAGIAVSAQNGEGLAELAAACVRTLAGPGGLSNEWIGTTAARCRESLVHSAASLSRAGAAAAGQLGDELVTLEVREAIDHLGRILGTVYTEDILDRIFSRFCIGK